MSTFLGLPTVPASPAPTCAASRPFPEAASTGLADAQLRRNLGRATWTIRDKRLRVTGEVPDWEELRRAGEAVKAATMARLPELLEQLEAAVTARGGTVHWARDAEEANRIMVGLALAALDQYQGEDPDVRREVVKVKSMATQETRLNEALATARSRPTRPTWPTSSSSWTATRAATSSSRPSTATARRSARSSCARCRARTPR